MTLWDIQIWKCLDLVMDWQLGVRQLGVALLASVTLVESGDLRHAL